MSGGLDSCPSCGQRGNAPQDTRTRGLNTVAVYRCARCRHTWWTSWSRPGRPAA